MDLALPALTPLQGSAAISPYNPLVVALILVTVGAAISAIYLFRESRGSHDPDDPQSFAWLFGLIGGFSLLVSGEIFWADWAGFPAAQYTELFGVAITLYAMVMLSAAFVLYTELDPRPFTWLTAVASLVLFQGARAVMDFGLTREPIVTAGIWGSCGIAGLLLLPAAYASEESAARTYLLYVVVGFLVVAAVLTGFMAIEAHYGHIAEVVAAG
jgi:putative membrane protein